MWRNVLCYDVVCCGVLPRVVENLGVRSQDSVHHGTDGHLDSHSIPLLPHPETQESFLVSTIITCLYHVFANIFTIAYWLKSSDSPYIKFGVEEDQFDGGDTQLFGKFLFIDLDRLWSPRYRHASAIYWLIGPILLRKHCQNELSDPLFRIEAGLGDEEEAHQPPITEKSPIYRLRKAQMSMSYRYMPVYSWTLFRFFWFFYMPPVTLLGHIRFAALMIAYNREIYTFGAANYLVSLGLVWTTVMIWFLVVLYILVWFTAYLHDRLVGYLQRREWEMHRRDIKRTTTTNNNSNNDGATAQDFAKRLKRNQVSPGAGK